MTSSPPFAQLLRQFRTTAGFTQEALADRCGLSSQAIGALENGRRRFPRPTTVAQLADALDLAVDERRQLVETARRPKVPARSSGAPQQLPPALSDFTGRTEDVEGLLALVRNPQRAAPGIVLSAIGGMGGVGKTALAVQVAHLAADAFPDGQLYLNLRGGSADPISSVAALDTLLQMLGLTFAAATDNIDATSARYRTALAGRKLLLLLDDAASVEQILPLLPGTSGVVVLVTSRSPLAALSGAHRMTLDVLTEAEALRLLEEVVGPEQLAAEPTAATDVVRSCGLLPLAIRIAGGHARSTSMKDLAARLADADGRFDVLTGPNAEVRRNLSLSLERLARSDHRMEVEAAAAFPTLSLFDGEHFPLRAAAAVLGRSLDDTEDLLELLVDFYILDSPAVHQYRMHDLVREIGRNAARAEFGEGGQAEIRRRELACYTAVLWRRDMLADSVDRYGARAGRWAEEAEDLLELDAVIAWLEIELPNLRRLIQRAATEPDHWLLAVRAALGMPTLAATLMRFAEARAALTAVASLPIELPGPLEIARSYSAALMCGSLGLDDEALGWLQQVLPVARDRGTVEELGRLLIDLGFCLGRLGRPDDGLPYAEEGLALISEVEGTPFRSAGHLTVGILAGQVGDLERQRRAFDEVLTLPDPPKPGIYAVHKSMMGRALRETGQHAAALELLQTNLAEIQGLGTDVIEADALVELGALFLETGDAPKALEKLEAGLVIASRHPAEHREAPLLKLLGEALAAVGRTDEAREAWQRAAVLYDREADARAAEVKILLSEA